MHALFKLASPGILAILCLGSCVHPPSVAAQAREQPILAAGDTIFKADFSNPVDRAKWPAAPFASWAKEGKNGGTVLKVVVPSTEAAGKHMITLPIDLNPYEGMRLWLRCQAKATDVSAPPQDWNGVKFMLHYTSRTREFWRNKSPVYGSFDWKELAFSALIDEDILSGELCLGLENSSGEACFDKLEIVIASGKAAKRPAPMKNPPPAFTGHADIERLRGAMSPTAFKEEDFKVFANEWNANLVRWQITSNWGKPGSDMDLGEYDHWLEGKMAELDLLLAAALKYRFKVVIDLHSPPGGRLEDNSLRMFYERKYNDHFVEVWKRLATRYNRHPAVWAYDLVNEPVEERPAPLGMDYLSTQTRAAKAVRAIDPRTAVIIESGEWDSPGAYREMRPVDVSNVVYQVHMYEPGSFTHQGVHNVMGVQSGQSVVAYPGLINGVNYNRKQLREILQPVRDFQLAYNVHIYVGEFSAIRWAPGAAQYISDCIDIFEEYGWDWSYHAFREWDGWSVEHSNDRNDHTMTTPPTDRKQVLLKWLKKNQKPQYLDER